MKNTNTITDLNKAVQAVHNAAELAYGHKLGFYGNCKTDEEKFDAEAWRLGIRLTDLDIVLKDEDADLFDGVINILASEVGADSVEEILSYSYQLCM